MSKPALGCTTPVGKGTYPPEVEHVGGIVGCGDERAVHARGQAEALEGVYVHHGPPGGCRRAHLPPAPVERPQLGLQHTFGCARHG